MVAERFYSKIEHIPFCDCWLWNSNRDKAGYGLLSFGTPPKRTWRKAHRVSYELHKGAIPDGMDICHKCDVPSCVNPDHLFVGDQKMNTKDSIDKGRFFAKNYLRGNHKLTESQVYEIRSGSETAHFAKKFGVSQSTIKRARRRITWKHLS